MAILSPAHAKGKKVLNDFKFEHFCWSFSERWHGSESVKTQSCQVCPICRHRGLRQLMKGRGVNTVGNLASLSEVEVQSMPVRAPKVKTVKEALTNFHLQHCAKKSGPLPAAAAAVQHHDK